MTDLPRPVLYLLPGLLCDARIWAHQIAQLGADREIRVPDFTRSDTIAGMADEVLAGSPPRFSLAGHSMGGRVALEVIRLAPERVERLALLDTGIHPVRPGERDQRQKLVALAATHGMAALAEAWLPPMVHPDHVDDPAMMAPMRAMVLRMSPDIFSRQIAALLGRPDAASVLPAIRCPVMVGVGREDRWSPPEQHGEIAAAIAGATYVVFDRCGHMAPIEAAAAVTAALRHWLAAPWT